MSEQRLMKSERSSPLPKPRAAAEEPSQELLEALERVSSALSPVTGRLSTLLTQNQLLQPALAEMLAQTVDVQTSAQTGSANALGTIADARLNMEFGPTPYASDCGQIP